MKEKNPEENNSKDKNPEEMDPKENSSIDDSSEGDGSKGEKPRAEKSTIQGLSSQGTKGPRVPDPHDPDFHHPDAPRESFSKAAYQVPPEGWRTLLILGGAAPFLTLLLYLSQLFFISWETYPENIIQWFELFRESRFLALFYLNSLDIISIGVLGVMFLALFMVLRETNRSLMTMAAPFAFLGIGVFIVPRTLLLSIAGLSRDYFAALKAAGQAVGEAETAAAERGLTEIAAAGRAISSLGVPTIQTAGFLILALAALPASLAMLRSPVFSQVTGTIGIAAAVLTLLDDLSLVLFPAAATPLLIVAGFAWVIWWVLVGRRLLLLGLGRGRKAT